MSQKNIKILNYAVNGLGLGHISRLISINRWIRRISGALGVNTEIYFLTSSECDSIAYQNGFPSFKIPSKKIIQENGLSYFRYRKIAKQWVWNAVNLFSPDLLIVDTFPHGSFNELPAVFDLGFKKNFIYRSIKNEITLQKSFQNILTQYDKIIIPSEDNNEEFIYPERVNNRIFHTGEILIRDRDELHSREYARELFGITEDKLICYFTAGGGGDPDLESQFKKIYEIMIEIPEVEFIIGAGPLYKGHEFRAKNVSWYYSSNIMEYFNAFDFAISAGGYNSTYELLYVGIPTIFFHQERMYDDQENRINKLVEKEICLKINEFSEIEIKEKIEILKDINIRNKFKNNSFELFKKNYAFDTAKIILDGFISESDMEHIENIVKGEYFYKLKESKIPEYIGLSTLNKLDYNFNQLKKQNSAIEQVSEFFDLSEELKEKLSGLTNQIYIDFIEYPLHNIAIGFLKFAQNKNIHLPDAVEYLDLFINLNYSVKFSIQDLVLEATRQIDLWSNLSIPIIDSIKNYISLNKEKRL